MIKVGMLIADRYEIIEKIGTGGMSDVYRAKDHKLNRFVAVKVLKQEFSENTDFVSKFRTEAQAAAGLMHPNIVNVYDVGEEKGFHYIVMELVEGITLKKYIEKKARLSVREAVSTAILVSQGIEAAHNNHIIHRDIKPQNIIISRDGKVKVTDFGIAKAATSNTITSNVMGSVHYTSPEQVRGGFSDEKSDIYSLGITLFEMLTGRVPFNGETTVAVAIKHIQEQMPSPRDFVPEIPISVEQIVLKCTQKSPDRRYVSTPELIEDLKRSLISPDENFVHIDDGEVFGGTKDLREIRDAVHQRDKQEGYTNGEDAPADRVNPRKKKNGERPSGERPSGKNKPKKKRNDNPEEQEYGNYQDEYEDGYYEDGYVDDGYQDGYDDGYYEGDYIEDVPPKKPSGNTDKIKTQNGSKSPKKNVKPAGKKKPVDKPVKKNSSQGKKASVDDYNPKAEFITTVLVVIAAIIIGCVFLYIVGKFIGLELPTSISGNFISGESSQITMIDVKNLECDAATYQLENIGFKVVKIYQESAEVEANHVIGASVEPETACFKGTEVTIYVSSGVGGAKVPNVVGRTRAEATAILENDGYKANIIKESSDSVAADVVISQSPEGDTVIARGATVDVRVSLGAEKVSVTMPNVVGQQEAEALAILQESGLNGKVVSEEYSSTVPEGCISYQSISAGSSANAGEDIELRKSLGPEQVYYQCSLQVNAPSDYAGGNAQVVLKGADGSQLFATDTGAFPVDINVSGILGIPTGEIYITYNINQTQEVTDADGNVTIQNVQVQNVFGPQVVEFARQQ